MDRSWTSYLKVMCMYFQCLTYVTSSYSTNLTRQYYEKTYCNNSVTSLNVKYVLHQVGNLSISSYYTYIIIWAKLCAFWQFWLWRRTVGFAYTGQSDRSLPMSLRGLRLFFLCSSLCTHMHVDTKRHKHVYDLHIHIHCSRLVFHKVRWQATNLLGSSWLMPLANSWATHTGSAFVKPLHPHAPSTDGWHGWCMGMKTAKSISCSLIRLQASVWPGSLIPLPRGGRHISAGFATLAIPSSYLHMDTHKHWNTQTHGGAYSPHHPPSCWVLAHG